MIYTFDLPDGGMIATGEGGKKMINDAITKSIEELLTILHNEPELQVVNPLSTDSYTYNVLTKEKFLELLKGLGYETESSNL